MIEGRKISYKVVIYPLEDRRKYSKRNPWRVRWKVDGEKFPEAFGSKGLAKSFRSRLESAFNSGEAFDVETGLPMSMLRERLAQMKADSTVSWFTHAKEYSNYKWSRVAAKSRIGIAEVMRDVTCAVLPDGPDRPKTSMLRKALFHHAFVHGDPVPISDEVADVLQWCEDNSPAIEDFEDTEFIREILDALAQKMDGKRTSPAYFHRRRTILSNSLKRAVKQKRLRQHPLQDEDLEWEGPLEVRKVDNTIDPREVGNPRQVEQMLTAVSYVGNNQGLRFVAFFGALYYAMLRPEEAAPLRLDQFTLPAQSGQWGALMVEAPTPTAGKRWTDSGEVNDERCLKHRVVGEARPVPIPPVYVQMIRDHVEAFGVGPGGELFLTVNGTIMQSSTYLSVWRRAREFGLAPHDRKSALLRRPYSLRVSGVSVRRYAGVPSRQVAEWAGHSVEVLERAYSKVMSGYDDRWQGMMNDFMGT
ncbi:hypothetical protein FB566_2383 [Stackebrandtia endophytica]|uniref:Tyr recombinase domain-containing protein n=1 Tax=Stackebrandtia endophytica TaxID=1496996 RepID=A0A543AWA5_9ACTN|nr:site-specific integrase [Stackebrandtia endophytica]TQL76842.1 hypothetical protein FB566_2383 [Stackebrandtia endophytica]